MALVEAMAMATTTADGAHAPALYVHCGDDDGLGFLPYALDLHGRLVAKGVPHELRVSDGGHGWPVWATPCLSADWLRFVDRALRG